MNLRNVILNVRDMQSLTLAIAASASPSFLFFWLPTHDRSAPDKGCLSQWHEVLFTVEGRRYPTAEHFMMAHKAALFGNEAVRTQILRAPTLNQVKKLGRQVANFDEATWMRERVAIVVAGNQVKFSQHPGLRAFLLGTDNQVLVEASPLDRIWGIGLADDHPNAVRPAALERTELVGFSINESARPFEGCLKKEVP
jgi:ribA/ribD-fused uncharacterized protein